MGYRHLWVVVSALLISVASSKLHASGLLTFESTPAGTTPVDDTQLSSPYTINNGTVRFFFDTNGNNTFDAASDQNPVFEQTKDNGTNAFVSTHGVGNFDTARSGFEDQLGTYMLRTPTGLGGTFIPGAFVADYDTTVPIRELSGEIWDIDGQAGNRAEQWQVDVLNASGNVLATLLSPIGTTIALDSLDSLPWTFQFHDLPDGVDKLRLTYIGTDSDHAGLAFNNFSPDVAVPEPSCACLLTLAGLAVMRRCRSSKRAQMNADE